MYTRYIVSSGDGTTLDVKVAFLLQFHTDHMPVQGSQGEGCQVGLTSYLLHQLWVVHPIPTKNSAQASIGVRLSVPQVVVDTPLHLLLDL